MAYARDGLTGVSDVVLTSTWGSTYTDLNFCECFEELSKCLHYACDDGYLEDVRRLIDEGANVNFMFDSAWTPLLRASARGHADVVSLLVKSGADIEARVGSGFTALHLAASHDPSGRCVSILIQAGADIDACNDFKRTPLHYASEDGNEAAARALVAAGASKTAKDDTGCTPIDVANNIGFRRLLRRI